MQPLRKTERGQGEGLRLVRGEPPWSGPRPPMMLRLLSDQAQHAIERADSKASTLAATATAVLAILIQDGSANGSGRQGFLQLGAGALWVAGIAVLTVVIFPRFRPRQGPEPRLISFVDFPVHFDLDEMRELARAIEADPEEVLLVQAHSLSRIAVLKYRLVRIGMLLLGGGLALGIAGVVFR